MINRRPRPLAAAAFVIVSALACSDGTAAPKTSATSSQPVASKPIPTVIRLTIVPDVATIPLSSGIVFAAYKVLSDSSRLPVTPFWNGNNDQVLAVNAANGYVVAVGPGQAIVTARVDGLIAAATVTVPAPTSLGTSDVMLVDSFSMIEFQYASAPGHWFYAPQVRVHATPGHTASVLVLKFSIPGLGNPPPFGCGANLSVMPRDLFGEVYGDWLLEIDDRDRRATGEPATATITFVDDAGTVATRVVSGPIVQGSLPTTYTGGENGGACFHVYGSTG